MATEKQIEYLNSLINTKRMGLDAFGLGMWSLTYRKVKYAGSTIEERRAARANRANDDAEMMVGLRAYLDSLNPETMSMAEASSVIDALKNDAWVSDVAERLVA